MAFGRPSSAFEKKLSSAVQICPWRTDRRPFTSTFEKSEDGLSTVHSRPLLGNFSRPPFECVLQKLSNHWPVWSTLLMTKFNTDFECSFLISASLGVFVMILSGVPHGYWQQIYF